MKKILKTKDDLCVKLNKIEVFKFVIFRKKHKNNQNKNLANLILTGKRESEELQNKSNASFTATWKDVEETTALKDLSNSILNSNTLNSMQPDYNKTVITHTLQDNRVFD